jgi:hypothetical protein
LRNFKVFLISFLTVYFAFNALVYAKQRDMMYIPSLERVTPADVGLDEVEEVALTTAFNVELISWFARPRDDRPTVLFFHGNAGAVEHRAYRFREFMAHGYGVFVLGYPGYGGNAGEPSEPGFHEASQLAYDYLRASGFEADDIVIYGESIGSGVAVQLAARVDAKGLILEAPMSSAVAVAREHYALLVATFFLRDSYRSEDYIDRIDMPLLVIHGEKDAIIPLGLGRELVERAVEPKKLVVIEGAGHNNLSEYSAGRIAREFIESL